MALSPAEEKFRLLRNILACFSLANLFFVSTWYRIQDLQAPFANYFRDHRPDLTILKATLLDAIVVTFVFAALWWFAGKFPAGQRVWDCIFLAVVALGLEATRSGWHTVTLAEEIRNGCAIGTEVAVVAGLVLRAVSSRREIVVATGRVLLFFNFLFLALAVHFVSGWIATPGDIEFVRDPAAPANGTAGPRVLWLLFDSLDERMTFDARHASLQLPELDRLRSVSFWAAEAYPPARYTTYSVPALLTGRLFQAADPQGPEEILLTPRGGGPPVSWLALSSLFYDVRKLGLDARVSGWYHPYCRLFGGDLADCLDQLGVDSRATQESYAASLGLAGSMSFVFRQRAEYMLVALHLASSAASEILPQSYAQTRQQQQYFAIHRHALETLPRFSGGLFFVHYPVPHPPGLYDRRKQSFDVNLSNTYLDNLALVDRTIGELRAALEKDGLWENLTIIVTADHGYRPEIWSGAAGVTQEMQEAVAGSKSLTVPVLIHFAGEQESRKYSAPFNNALLHDLSLAILQRQVNSSADTAKWFDANKDRLPTSPPQPIP